MDALPFCKIILMGKRPKPREYPKQLNTLGDHIRARRLDLGMLQAEVADRIGITEIMLCHWEKQRYRPSTRFLPKIINFLGYAPYETPTSFAKWLRQVRTCLGLSQECLAAKAGVDESSIAQWERGDRQPTLINVRLIRDTLIEITTSRSERYRRIGPDETDHPV
jgi:transcriptional regulator with XRE-family HTH domain